MHMFDYTLLKGFIASKGFTLDSMAARIGISKASLQARLSGKAAFTLNEARTIAQLLELDQESINACFFAARI